MLELLGGLVAHAHRAAALKAGQVGGDALVDRLGRHDAVDRAQRALAVDGNVGDIIDVFFHGLSGAETVERLDDEKCIAQPAVAVIPGPLRARSFGDRGGVGGDDGARLLEAAQLERDGCPDDVGLKLERDGKRAHPVEPVVAGSLEKFARGRIDRRLEGLVWAQDQRHRLDQGKRRLMGNVGERSIGRDAQRIGTTCVADVVGAAGTRSIGSAVVEGRPNPDLDARQTRRRLDPPEDLRRIEHALETLEAGHEIGDAQRIAGGIADGGLYDRRIAQVDALRGDCPFQHHVAEPLLLAAGKKARKDGVRIEARKAPPRDAAADVHQRCRSAIADHRKVEGIAPGTVN